MPCHKHSKQSSRTTPRSGFLEQTVALGAAGRADLGIHVVRRGPVNGRAGLSQLARPLYFRHLSDAVSTLTSCAALLPRACWLAVALLASKLWLVCSLLPVWLLGTDTFLGQLDARAWK